MRPTSLLFVLPLVAFCLGELLLTGCAAAGAQQPMGRRDKKSAFIAVQQEQTASERPLALFAGKRKRAAAEAQPEVVAAPAPAPQAPAAAEPASESPSKVAVEPDSESKSKIAAETKPKRRGPLTREEENEIDAQVMP